MDVDDFHYVVILKSFIFLFFKDEGLFHLISLRCNDSALIPVHDVMVSSAVISDHVIEPACSVMTPQLHVRWRFWGKIQS